MTTFEHGMFGATSALAMGCRRKYGWTLVIVAAIAAALPDWDGLSLAFGADAYANVHRVWGHYVLVAGSTGILATGLGYLFHLSTRTRRSAVPLWAGGAAAGPVPAFSGWDLAQWILTGLVASLSHLPADLVYSGRPGMRNWPLKLLWPFSHRGWALPVVAWGDLVATFIFVGGMFALYHRPNRAQVIAVFVLLSVHFYVGFCWLAGGVGK